MLELDPVNRRRPIPSLSVSVLWIPLLAIVTGLCLRSARKLDVIGYIVRDRPLGETITYSLTSSGGDLCFAIGKSYGSVGATTRTGGYVYSRTGYGRFRSAQMVTEHEYGLLGLLWIKESDSVHTWRRVQVPYAFIALLILLWPMHVWRTHRRREMWRARGYCVNCGYDLRASETICPECGTPITRYIPPRPVWTRGRLIALPLCEGIAMLCAIAPLSWPPLAADLSVRALADFRFDPKSGTLNDIPEEIRKLNGQRVALTGMVSPMWTWSHKDRFQLVDPEVFRGALGPRIQGFVDVVAPADASTVQLNGSKRVTGTLYVHPLRSNGYVTSVFQLDAESIEPAD